MLGRQTSSVGPWRGQPERCIQDGGRLGGMLARGGLLAEKLLLDRPGETSSRSCLHTSHVSKVHELFFVLFISLFVIGYVIRF